MLVAIKKILMADLRMLLEKLDFQNIQTYLQSGNVVFHSSNKSIPSLENAIKKQLLKQYGFDVPVIVKTPKELLTIFDDCPFLDEKKQNSYFMLFKTKPDEDLKEKTN